jgi:hypothetical protein
MSDLPGTKAVRLAEGQLVERFDILIRVNGSISSASPRLEKGS